jgi:predicted nucleotidyltransferase
MATIPDVDEPRLPVDTAAVTAVAKRWSITRLSLFGSILRSDFREDSDVDLLIEFSGDVKYSLFDIAQLKHELELVFRRQVDIVEPAALTNPYRRRHIMQTAKVLYAA